jgi:thiamine pyrophosphokinase
MTRWAESATHLVAVDAGFHHLDSVGKLPAVIAGDFDSADLQRVPEGVLRVHLPDQSHTDFEKVLRWCFEQGFESIHVACAEGDLPDHQLQNFYSAGASLVDVWFVFGRGMGRIVRAEHGAVKASAQVGARVSLIPLSACDCVTLTGVQWPLSSGSLIPLGSSSISNRAVKTEIEVALERGVALLFWETNDVVWE